MDTHTISRLLRAIGSNAPVRAAEIWRKRTKKMNSSRKKMRKRTTTYITGSQKKGVRKTMKGSSVDHPHPAERIARMLSKSLLIVVYLVESKLSAAMEDLPRPYLPISIHRRTRIEPEERAAVEFSSSISTSR